MPSSPYDRDSARDGLSRVLVAQSRRMARVELPAPLTFLAPEVLDDVMVSHPLGWTIAAPLGWGSGPSSRRHMEIEASRLNPGTRDLRLCLRDLRGAIGRNAYWVQGRAPSQSDMTMGPIALANNLVCYRPGSALTEYADGQVVTTIAGHTPRFSAQGLLVERYTGCILTDSCMSGLGADWTAVGAGVGGSSIANATTLIVWDRALSPNYKLFTAGTPHTADLYLTQTPLYWVFINMTYCLTFTYLAPAGVTGTACQIILGGQYWNVATQAWQAGAVWNYVSGGESGIPYRVTVPFGASASAAPTVRIGCPTGGTAGRQVCVFDAEIQRGIGTGGHPWASSRIQTSYGAPGNTASRQGEWVVSRDNLPPQGTLLARVTPLWSSIVGPFPIGSFLFTVFANHKVSDTYLNCSSRVVLYYDGSTSSWVLRRMEAAADTEIAISPVLLTRDTAYRLAFRWESLAGELREKYGTPAGGNTWFDLTANGITAYAQSVPPSDPAAGVATSFFHGCDVGEASQFDGFVSLQVLPYVLSDAEVAKWL